MSDVMFTSWHSRVLQVESEGSQPSPKELREQAQSEDMLRDMLRAWRWPERVGNTS